MHITTGLNSDRIQVGVILREDRQTSVSVSWAEGSLLESSVGFPVGVSAAEVRIVDGELEVENSLDSGRRDHVVLRAADDVHHLSPGDGIKIAPVRTGRGFHWQKDIRVTLPGELHFRVRDGFLEVVNRVDVESYVACVATSEMGAAAPAELLAAQTIVARCWAQALVEQKHRVQGFDVCNDDCCQRYQGTTYVSPRSIAAARDTAGKALVYDGKVIDARYSKNCGGIVEDYTSVWDGRRVPYLVPVWDSPNMDDSTPHYANFNDYYHFEDAFCAPSRFVGVDLQSMLGKVDVSGSYYRWQQQITLDAILDKLRKHFRVDWESIEDFKVVKRGASARIQEVLLTGKDREGHLATQSVRSEYSIRQTFSDSFLYSSAFEILNSDTFQKDGRFDLRGCGWGHGVGLCQMGALGMALARYPVEKILQHYYPGAEFAMLDSAAEKRY